MTEKQVYKVTGIVMMSIGVGMILFAVHSFYTIYLQLQAMGMFK